MTIVIGTAPASSNCAGRSCSVCLPVDSERRAPLDGKAPGVRRRGIVLVKNPVFVSSLLRRDSRNASAKAVTDSNRLPGSFAIARSKIAATPEGTLAFTIWGAGGISCRCWCM